MADLPDTVEVKRLFKDTRVLVADIETTGFNFDKDFIIELGIVEFIDGELLRENSALFGGGSSPESALAVHRITDESRAGRETFMQRAAHFKEYAEYRNGNRPTIWVGHNILDFDMPFLLAATRRGGCQVTAEGGSLNIVDTLALAKRYLKAPNNRLGTLCSTFGITYGEHRAGGDAMSTWQLLLAIMRLAKTQHINELVTKRKLS